VSEDSKKTGWLGLLCAVAFGAAIGSIILLPWIIAREAHEFTVIYLAVESCKTGADLEVCRTLRGEE
jgi:hypothetical protein